MPKLNRSYEVTDESALFGAYPQFFKQTLDHSKVKRALSIGIQLPGVSTKSVESTLFAKGETNVKS